MLEIFAYASIAGAALSVLLMVLMAVSFWIAPDMWVGDYPPEIEQRYGEMSEKAKRYRTPVAMLFFGLVVLVPLLGIVWLRSSTGLTLGFPEYVIFSFICLSIFNLVDLLVIDWLIFVTIQPDVVVLPGTEGMTGYKDYGFHFRAFLSGIGFSLAGALIVAGLAWLIL